MFRCRWSVDEYRRLVCPPSSSLPTGFFHFLYPLVADVAAAGAGAGRGTSVVIYIIIAQVASKKSSFSRGAAPFSRLVRTGEGGKGEGEGGKRERKKEEDFPDPNTLTDDIILEIDKKIYCLSVQPGVSRGDF